MFNLQVDGEPEYFANGILVHNCDVTAYAAQLTVEDAILKLPFTGDLSMADRTAVAMQMEEPVVVQVGDDKFTYHEDGDESWYDR